VGARATLIYLLRHGEVVLAETHRFLGHLDVPLSERGEQQSRAQAARLAGTRLVAVFTSDLARARRTAEIIASPHGLTPTVIPELREMAMGRWDGRTAEEIRRTEPEAFADWMGRVGEFPFPEGESVPDLRARAWPAFEAIVGAHAGARPRARPDLGARSRLWRADRAGAARRGVAPRPAQRAADAIMRARFGRPWTGTRRAPSSRIQAHVQ
jgi:broad specificity phosphatase PhoE